MNNLTPEIPILCGGAEEATVAEGRTHWVEVKIDASTNTHVSVQEAE